MSGPIPPPLSIVVTALRVQAEWMESALAADLGVSKSPIADGVRHGGMESSCKGE
jgi:hypothetical protein